MGDGENVSIVQYKTHFALLINGVVVCNLTKTQLQSLRDFLDKKNHWFED